ncbi:MAG: DUF1284 domain-containing protein [Methanobrevibacter thaueri]|nr:DUF1284 domain-containing protein [Methanobrevibacter thaueri]
MKLTLRGHHLLCLKGFQGYGYDEDFTKNMTCINIKRKDIETTVNIVDYGDDICKYCPNLVNGICENEKQNERIISMDREVLNKLDSGKEYNSVELFNKIDDIFNSKESVSKICFNCLWHDECLFYQKLSNNR